MKEPPMSNSSDPVAVLTALDRAQDAFDMVGRGQAAFEDGISADEDWKTQLTKACRLLEVVDTLQSQDGYYTAIIEVCFGAIERPIEAYALAMTDDTLQDFQDHQFSFDILPALKREDSRLRWDIRVCSPPPLSAVGIRRRGYEGRLRAVPTSRYSYPRPNWTQTRSYFRSRRGGCSPPHSHPR